MKYVFSFLVIVLLAGCSTPAGYAIKKMGTTVKQCCATLTFQKNSPPVSMRCCEETAAGSISASVFEPEIQLLHTTW